MLNKKNIKTHGKIRLSQYFQEFKEGERVAIIRDPAFNPAFPIRTQGRSGVVIGQKGSAYIIKLKNGNQTNFYNIKPIHLRRLG